MIIRKPFSIAMLWLPLIALLGAEVVADRDGRTSNPTGDSVETDVSAFLGRASFQQQTLFGGDQRVREPYLAVAVDGSILAMRNYAKLLRRSEDGGESWGEIQEVPFGFLDSNLIVDERSGHILSVRLWDGTDRLWRSRDHGRTWTEEKFTLKANEVMKWLERTGKKERGNSRRSRRKQKVLSACECQRGRHHAAARKTPGTVIGDGHIPPARQAASVGPPGGRCDLQLRDL